MSVINQVLNQLEQRGAHTALEQRTMVRAVPHSQRRLAMAVPLLVLGLALVAGIAVWQWMQARKPVLSLAEGPQIVGSIATQPQPAAVAIPAPVSAVPAAPPAIASEVPLAEVLPPVARAIIESSSLPSVPRQDSGRRATTKPLALSTVEGSGQAASTGSGQALRDGKNSPAPSGGEGRPVKAAPRSAKPQPIQAAPPNAQAAAQPPVEVSPMKQVSPAQHAEAEFRKAVALMQQGHIADAMAGYEAVLRLDAGHDAARQALVALLLESKRGAYAERVLQDGLKNKPEHTGFAMLLARLQVERSAVDQAAATLEKSLPYANAQADYQAFYAALLQRQNRHKEAIAYYQVALQLAPDNGIWLMGYGISLQAMQRADDARDAFRRALESKTLNPELQAFVQQKLKGL
ncbi:MAG: tetratricopeptide repeat protein [Gallionellaceae bacterium]